LKNITDRKERSDPLIPSDLPGRIPSTILIKPNGINGHSRSLSGTPTPLLPPAKSTIRIPPGTLSKKKKSRDVSFPDSPAIIRTADGMVLFKTADEELDVEESNIESRLREFILEDPEEFVDPDSEEETALTGDKRKLYVLFTYPTRDWLTQLTGTARMGNARENVLGGRRPLGSGGLTCGGRSCNVTSSSATVTLHYSTLHQIRTAHLRLSPLGRHSHRVCRHRGLGGNDGKRPQKKTLMLPTTRFLA